MNRARVLVVEDERIVAMDIQGQLENLDYDVVATAASGEEAIRKAKNTIPDLALMDIRIKGGMDGIEVAQHLRAELCQALGSGRGGETRWACWQRGGHRHRR